LSRRTFLAGLVALVMSGFAASAPSAGAADPEPADAAPTGVIAPAADAGTAGPAGAAGADAEVRPAIGIESAAGAHGAALVAARDAVAAALVDRGVGDFVVDVDPATHRIQAEITSAGVVGDALTAAALRRAADAGVAVEAPEAAPTGTATDAGATDAGATDAGATDAGATDAAGSDAARPRVDVSPRRSIAVEPLRRSAADVPPYGAGLAVDVAGGASLFHGTSAWAFVAGDGTTPLGSTAGHCGDVGAPVAVGDVPIGVVADNGYYPVSRVVADVALFTLPGGAPVSAAVQVPPRAPRLTTGTVPDGQLAVGTQLCFAGRASGGDQCGPVTAVDRVTCCDATGRTFVFTCIDQVARSGDSGAPVYRPVGVDGAEGAGILSSSVTLDGRSSMCFTTLDAIEATTGARIVTTGG
jgi:hypothetical protein